MISERGSAYDTISEPYVQIVLVLPVVPSNVKFFLWIDSAFLRKRHQVALAAYSAHPERYVNGPPRPAVLPHAVWINPPDRADGATDEELHEMRTATVSNSLTGSEVCRLFSPDVMRS